MSAEARTARDVVEELFRRGAEGDLSVIDELVAEDMVNHAAGPQGRAGWKQILATIDATWGRRRSSTITWWAMATSSLIT